MSEALIQRLSQLARERRTAVVILGGRPTGLFPLWPTADGLRAVSWTRPGDPDTYRLLALTAATPLALAPGGEPVTVPPLDLATGAFLAAQPGVALAEGATGARAVLEGVALAARFARGVVVCYRKSGADQAEWRRLGNLSLREDLVVASDQVFSAVRSFRYERILAIKVQEGVPAPRWTGSDYTC